MPTTLPSRGDHDRQSGEARTFGELHEAATRLAHALADAGLGVGDHVALCVGNHPAYLELLWGCTYAGVLYTAISTRLSEDELRYIVSDCSVDFRPELPRHDTGKLYKRQLKEEYA